MNLFVVPVEIKTVRLRDVQKSVHFVSQASACLHIFKRCDNTEFSYILDQTFDGPQSIPEVCPEHIVP